MRVRRVTCRVLSRTRMTLTPDLALAYLRELSADFRAGVVLDAEGRALAGHERLAAPAREVLWGDTGGGSDAGAGGDASGGSDAGAAGDTSGRSDAGAYEGATAAGKVFARRTASVAILVTTGPFALPSVARLDLLTVVAALGAESAQESPVQRIPRGYVEALLKASN